ncbi:MAG TPA: hypothetical protein VGH89_28415 [Pseudonocardia sp.]
MLALVGAVLFLIAAIVILVHDPIQLNVLLKVLGFLLLALQLGGIGRYAWRQFEALGLVAALLFVIALILELTVFPGFTNTILTTAGFIVVALYLAGIGPRTFRRL